MRGQGGGGGGRGRPGVDELFKPYVANSAWFYGVGAGMEVRCGVTWCLALPCLALAVLRWVPTATAPRAPRPLARTSYMWCA